MSSEYPQLDQAIEDAVSQGIPTRYIAYGLIQLGWPPPIVQRSLDIWLEQHGRVQKTTEFKDWLKKYKAQAKPGVVIMVFLNTIAAAIALLRPWPTKILADSVFGNTKAPSFLAPYTHTTKLIAIVSLFTITIFLFGALFSILKDFILLKIGYSLNKSIKEESFRHILHLPLYHQERLSKGDYIYRQNFVTNSLSGLVLDSTSSIIESCILIVGVLIIMLKIQPKLTLIGVLLVPLLFVLIKVISPKMGKISRQLTVLASKASSHITESIDNAETIQAFTLEDRQVVRLNQMWLENYELAKQNLKWVKLFNISNGLLVVLGTSAVMYFGGSSVLHHQLSLGQLLIFMTYLGYLLSPVQQVANHITSHRQKTIDVRRIYEVLSDHEGVETLRRDKQLQKVKGQIELQHVSFSYNNLKVLDDVSLNIPAGQKVGIIGPSGAGKSTILKLLPLFIEPENGRLLIDGIDSQTVSLHALRRNIGWISQTPQLFSESISENIIDGDIFRRITEEELYWATKAANVDEFAVKLPLKYQTPAGENGSSLSGGQRQRISIARALIKNAPIICMDEPTSALDDHSEILVRESIGNLIKGKTVILVTHRLSLLSLMDKVYVLEGGKLRDVLVYGGYENYAHYLQAHEQI